ncbi:uncharacterized protein K452DRAFT_304883 [Aplosporella prunicola CBS 121167]|uniref:Uncharacterized protein n=1 Tax=Aplosporella prunicola CBS 121167 TaxID=1176127 RepID=A0A6A6BSD0_9PEZI|nr:uncharacterized protein K452DRAFT_304883 [Aplosporella prunicola CBS 121167]KAF2146986.1 hypothetical protein K452DRAFT_304883 [Aplosporella prunicola CBS 121167]
MSDNVRYLPPRLQPIFSVNEAVSGRLSLSLAVLCIVLITVYANHNAARQRLASELPVEANDRKATIKSRNHFRKNSKAIRLQRLKAENQEFYYISPALSRQFMAPTRFPLKTALRLELDSTSIIRAQFNRYLEDVLVGLRDTSLREKARGAIDVDGKITEKAVYQMLPKFDMIKSQHTHPERSFTAQEIRAILLYLLENFDSKFSQLRQKPQGLRLGH